MLMTVDKIRRAAEQLAEGRKLRHQFGMDDFRIEPPQQARAQQLRKAQEHAAIERLEMHRQRMERRRQCRVQADRAARAGGDGGLSAATSSRPIAGPTTITEVALRRPRRSGREWRG